MSGPGITVVMRRVDVSRFFASVNPRMVAVITSLSPEGEPNAMAATWHSPISHRPPLYGVSISPKRATHDNVERTGVFGVNFLPFELVQKIHFVGRVSRRERRDKLRAAGIEVFEGPELGVPILDEAYVALECRVVDSRVWGDHTWFVGEVRSLLASDSLREDATVDLGRVRPSLYLGSDRYVTVDRSTEMEVSI